jgi:DHA1 family bicyclomycin/chloramphenicol resistance-like MFS transporter
MTHPPHSLLLLPILCLLAMLGVFSISIYLPSLPAVGKALEASQGSVQLTLTIFYLGTFIGALFLGPLSDQISRLLVVKAGLILFIIASFWCAKAQTIFNLQLGHFFQGMAASTGPLTARAIGRDLYEGSHLTKFSAIIMLGVSIASALGLTVGGIIEFYLGWEKSFYFLVFFGFFIAFLVWGWLPETNKYNKISSPSSVFRPIFKNYIFLLKDPYYRKFCLIIFTQMGSSFCYAAFSPYLFISIFGFLPQDYGYVSMAISFGNIIGFIVVKYATHYLYFYDWILTGEILCFLLSLIFVGICLLFPQNHYVLIIYIACFFILSPLVLINALAAAMNLFPHLAGTSSAMLLSVQIGSGILGSVTAAVLPISLLMLGVIMGSLSICSLITGTQLKWYKV